MQQVNGRWGAYDTSGTGFHRCFEKKDRDMANRATSSDLSTKTGSTVEEKEEQPQPQLKTLLEVTLLVQQMDERLRRVEGIVIDPRATTKRT
jgi:hypothetical protein